MIQDLSAEHEDLILDNAEERRYRRIEEMYNVEIDEFDRELIASIKEETKRPNFELTAKIMAKVREAIEFKNLVIDTHDIETAGLSEVLMEVGFADAFLNQAEKNILTRELMDIAAAEQLREITFSKNEEELTGLDSIDDLIYGSFNPGEV